MNTNNQPKYLQTDVEGLVKDPISGAILNVDNAKLEAYKKQKNMLQSQNTNTERINQIENKLTTIENLLQELLKR